MGRTTIDMDESDRDDLREFKNAYGWSYSEAIQELLDAWPDEDGWKGEATDDELAARVAAVEDTVEQLKERQNTIVENQDRLIERHENGL